MNSKAGRQPFKAVVSRIGYTVVVEMCGESAYGVFVMSDCGVCYEYVRCYGSGDPVSGR
ncbi:hypothetical protein HQ563_13770 [bacterium]|nr:hypothetical protein [bacterium]